MEKVPLQCGRMASVASEYCTLIDGGVDAQDAGSADWLLRLEKIFPRLHVAVTALSMSSNDGRAYHFYDDDKRCEMFLRLNDALQTDQSLCSAYEKLCVEPQRRQQLCERMADNLADMYFDLKRGLELLQNDPTGAAENWQHSFYVHWGKHLLDAECWLRAVESGNEPASLPEWRWPDAFELSFNPA